jgi:acyl carrier protein
VTIHVRCAIARELGFPLEDVTPEARLREDLWLDFFDAAELIEALEATFAVSVSDETLASLRTVADIEKEIETAGAQRAA